MKISTPDVADTLTSEQLVAITQKALAALGRRAAERVGDLLVAVA